MVARVVAMAAEAVMGPAGAEAETLAMMTSAPGMA